MKTSFMLSLLSVGSFLLGSTSSLFPAPANDMFANATLITGSSATVAGSNIGATKESGEPDHAGNAGGHSVWWKWVAPVTGSVAVNTIGSDFDTLLGVYTGSSVSALTWIASGDDIDPFFGVLTSSLSFNATNGTTYWIAVDGKNGACGHISLTVGANDMFANAELITGPSAQVGGTNIGATKESGEPDHGGESGGQSVWWKWVAPATRWVTIDRSGSDFNSDLGVYTGSRVDALTTIASIGDAYVYGNAVTFLAVQGTTYWIAVDGTNDPPAGNIVLNLTTIPPPANDLFANAILIPGATAQVTGTNVGAMKEIGEPDQNGTTAGQSVWWKWVAPVTGSVAIDTVGSNFDTLLGVYTGSSVNALTTIKEDDQSVTFGSVAGTTYWIAVDGYDGYIGATGNITLNLAYIGISPTSHDSPAVGDSYSLTITSNTAWTASSDLYGGFATVLPASGSGNGTVNVTVAPNQATVSRGATITVGGATHSLLQAANPPPAGPALSLDGTDDVVTAATSVYPNSSTLHSFTVEAWIYPLYIYNEGTVCIATDDAWDLFYVSYPVNRIRFVLHNSASQAPGMTEIAEPVYDYQWNHVAVMYDASANTLTIAVNGERNTTTSGFSNTGFSVDPNYVFSIGGNCRTGGNFYGYIDEVRISDIVRYPADFIPPADLASDANTRALWHFNECPGSTTFADASGHGFTLTGANGAQAANPPGAPTITTQPSGQAVVVGHTASFTAAASGTPAPTYQWQVMSTVSGSSWTDVPASSPYSGQATGTLTITGTTMSMSGYQYRCTATSAGIRAASNAAALTVNKAAQTINFPAPGNRYYGAAPFVVWAAASSGLPVTFSVVSGPATISGSLVTLTGAGVIGLAADQAGNANFLAAPEVTHSFTVIKAAATVTLGGLSATYNGSAHSATATTTPTGLTVTFTYNGGATAPTSAGNYAVVGTISDANYQGSASGTLVIAKAAQTINFPAPGNRTYGAAPLSVSGSASSGLPVTFSVVSGPATIAGRTVTMTGAGVIALAADQAGNANYLAAPEVTHSFTVMKAAATVSLGSLSATYDGTAHSATATTTPTGLTVTFTYNGGATAPTSVGSYAVVGTISDANYQGSASGTLVIAKAAQTITFAAPGNKTYGGASFNLSGSASSGLPLTFSVVSGPATVAGRTVTLTGAGTVTLRAVQAGNANYNAATSVDHSFTVVKALLTAKADDKSKVQGAANPPLTFSYSGFVNGDTAAVIDTLPTASTTATTSSPIGSYPITLTGGLDNNYTFKLVNGTLTVTAATSDQAFVKQLFVDLLVREPDANELSSYGAELATGTSRAAVLGDLLDTSEYKQRQIEPAIRLYEAALGRAPDYSDLQDWSNVLRSGVLTLPQAAEQFAGSAEFLQRYGALDDTQYVQQLYRSVLGREVGAADLASWVGQLDAGASRGSVLVGLSESAEFMGKIADQVEILRLHFLLLQRMPVPAELQDWQDFLLGSDDTGSATPAEQDLVSLANSFVPLDEQMRDDLLADPAFDANGG
jgi:hypothetical protein